MSDELSARRPRRPVTTQVIIRVARGGFIVSHNEEIPSTVPSYAQQQGIALGLPLPYVEGRETICSSLSEVNDVVAELLGEHQ